MGDPSALLAAPSTPEESVSNGFVNPVDLFNYVSPSAWINSGIEKATGIDIFGYFTDAVAGEWDAMWKFGEAMGHLADCLQELGINIQQGAIDLDAEWDGNAADAAYQYFSQFAASVSGQQLDLRDIQQNYHKAAQGAWQLSNQLGNILQAIADKFIIAGIAAAAGTITAETGVGAVVGYGVAGLQVLQMLKLFNDASVKINTAGSVIAGIFGGGMDIGYKGGDLSSVPLPTAAYTTPGA
ncbi:hypothetical protein OWR29_36785 [Actinoplanes sp. Pm04-4]|uniref:Uncharacterized protein n=1 Tax=Paractinoplanes pyxinae TaxID=2997416 RepID=A0ABT4BAN6_9ACTN|nr:hypothetical protein [Actinoplanes pyxinae]MCY1143589.1 hypothetical protein [Actinoplanes pyxinae]